MPIAGTASPAIVGVRDAGNEPASFRIYGITLTAANWTAQQTLWTDLKTAIVALLLGVVDYTEYGTRITELWAQPTNGATREIALLVQAKDTTTGQRFAYRLPAIDPTIPVYIVNVNAHDVVDPSTPAAITDFIDAFNAFAISPVTHNALTVIGLKVVRGYK